MMDTFTNRNKVVKLPQAELEQINKGVSIPFVKKTEQVDEDEDERKRDKKLSESR